MSEERIQPPVEERICARIILTGNAAQAVLDKVKEMKQKGHNPFGNVRAMQILLSELHSDIRRYRLLPPEEETTPPRINVCPVILTGKAAIVINEKIIQMKGLGYNTFGKRAAMQVLLAEVYRIKLKA